MTENVSLKGVSKVFAKGQVTALQGLDREVAAEHVTVEGADTYDVAARDVDSSSRGDLVRLDELDSVFNAPLQLPDIAGHQRDLVASERVLAADLRPHQTSTDNQNADLIPPLEACDDGKVA